MSEWKKVRLGEVCNIFAGGDAPDDTSPIRTNTLYVPVYSNGISRKGLYGYTSKSRVKQEAITISARGTIGAVFFRNEPFFPIVRLITVIPQSSGLDTKFLYYRLLLVPFAGDGSAVKQLTVPMISEYEIDFPPLPTQRKIAAVLSSLDDKIENNRKICANLEAQAQAIFKSWFVDDTRHIHDTVQMQKVFDVTIGRTPPRKESEWFSGSKDDNHVWVSIADMGSCGAFIFDSSEYLTDEAISKFNFKVVPRDTVLLSFKLTVGRVAVAATDLVTNEAIAHMRTSDIRLREYLYCYLKQFNYDNLGSTSSIATAVNSTTIKEMPFVVPKDKALSDFHQLVRPLFNQIRVLLHESRSLAALRDALLPKLMSGEIDVDKVEVA